MFAELRSRAIVRVSGSQTRAFLQGLLSNDVSREGAVFAALLSPQGKILFDLIALNRGEETLIDCEAARADELVAKIKLYRLRAKIEIERDLTGSVFARYCHPPKAVPLGNGIVAFEDPRLAALGMRLIGEAQKIRQVLSNHELIERPESDYWRHRVLCGVPEGAGELGIEKLFLLEANVEELNGVDFRKGCYIGQELTSRMKRKAELKKRLLPLAIEGEAPPETAVTAGEELLGQIIGSAPGIAFALLRLDRLTAARAAGTPLRAGEAPAELQVPAYLEGKV